MAKSEYTFEGSILEEWLETYLEHNGNIATDSTVIKKIRISTDSLL